MPLMAVAVHLLDCHSWCSIANRVYQYHCEFWPDFGIAGINIFGGFLVTRRMLAMFQKS